MTASGTKLGIEAPKTSGASGASTGFAAVYLAVTTSAQDISTTLAMSKRYELTVSVPCFVCQSDSGADASAGAGSVWIGAGASMKVSGSRGAVLSIKGESSGHATLVEVEVQR